MTVTPKHWHEPNVYESKCTGCQMAEQGSLNDGTYDYLNDIETTAKVINVPVTEFPGRCNEIAMYLLETGIAPEGSVNRYGHWLGEVTDKWFGWNPKLPFQRHVWLETTNGTIIDPTRWCFTGEEPYIYVGKNDGEYDFGGQRIRKALRPPFPYACGDNSCEDGYDDPMHKHCKDHRVELTPLFVDEAIPKNYFGDPQIEMDDDANELQSGRANTTLRTCQLFWIANAPTDSLGSEGKVVIRYLLRDGYRALVPIDTAQWAEGTKSALRH